MADYSDPLGLLFGGVDYFGSPQKSKGLLQLTPQEIERMAAAQSPAFGVFPQMQPYRSQQDITASANMPVDVARGRVAGTLGLFGDVFNQPIPMVRPLQLLSQAMTGQQKYPDTEYFLENLPLKSDTPVGDVAGRVGSFAPINPMPAVRGAQKLGGLLGEEMATRLNTGRPILPSLLAEPQTAMFAVNPAEQAMTSGLLQADVSPLGFYSAVEQQALKIPRKQGTGESFLNDLLKGQDVKKYEIEAMGLDSYLKGKPNVTRQEVQDFIQNNKISVEERQLSGAGDKSPVFSEFNPDENKYFIYTNDARLQGVYDTAEEADNFVKQYNSSIPSGPSKYDKYQLAGGENYRELLLKLPEQNITEQSWQVLKPDGTTTTGYYTTEEAARRNANYIGGTIRQAAPVNYTTGYRSSHWSDPNVLAHMRVNDRIDAEGKKMLLIEEVQSDWHQAGREQGYKNPETKKALEAESKTIADERNSLVAELSKQEQENGFVSLEGQQKWDKFKEKEDAFKQKSKDFASQVPDAPFKDTWYQLALKRAIKEAVDKGYDRIGLTTGKQQAARYNLSNEVDEINVIGRTNAATGEKTKTVALDMKTGRSMRFGVNNDGIIDNVNDENFNQFIGKNLSEVIGKDLSKQILEGKKTSFSGEGLSFGGEGMKKYYDEIYPNFLNKYGKKYGAQVGETKVNTVKERAENSMIPASKQETVRYLDITPEMKKAVQKGQPLAAVEGMTGLLA